MKYIPVEKLIAEIEKWSDGKLTLSLLTEIKDIISSLQQEQSRKFIEINGIRYKEVPAKTDDKICKECDYFLYNGSCNLDNCPCECPFNILERLQQEQPMPDSTKLIELWHEDKEMLKEKDFRDDPWRLAYNAFMCGFGRGIAVKKQEQPEVDLEKAARYVYESWMGGTMDDVRRDMVNLGKVLNARKEK